MKIINNTTHTNETWNTPSVYWIKNIYLFFNYLKKKNVYL